VCHGRMLSAGWTKRESNILTLVQRTHTKLYNRLTEIVFAVVPRILITVDEVL